MSKIADEHLIFANYLKQRVLTIDLWDGDSLMHFGTAKVPLDRHMRQGKPFECQSILNSMLEVQKMVLT